MINSSNVLEQPEIQRWITIAGSGDISSLGRRVQLGTPPRMVLDALQEQQGEGPSDAVIKPSSESTYYDVDEHEIISDFVDRCLAVDSLSSSEVTFETNDGLAVFWQAWLDVASHQLREQVPNEAAWLPVEEPCQSALLKELKKIGAQPLQSLLVGHQAIWKLRHGSDDATDDALNQSEAVTAFAERVIEDPSGYVLEEFPELARLLATRVAFWVESMAEFIRRLLKDKNCIEEKAKEWSGVSRLGEISDAEASLSDPHRRGRSVVIVEFESGFRIVYKPRPVDIDGAFWTFTEWMRKEEGPSVRAARTITRDGYGWAEYITKEPLSVSAETYYERAGALLCVMYVLRGKDFHCENIISASTHPVPIDLEVLCAPDPPPFASSNSAKSTSSSGYVVSRSGLLPTWHRVQGLTRDFGGFSDSGIYDKNNMDKQDSEQPQELGLRKNVPVGQKGEEHIEDHISSVIDGFSHAYRFFQKRQRVLLDQDGPLSLFEGLQTRFIFRGTKYYSTMRRQSTTSKLLRDPNARDLELDLLFRPWLRTGESGSKWVAIAHAEKAAMSVHDLPVFDHYTDGTDIYTPTDTIKDYFTSSGLQQVRAGIERLSVSDMNWQVALIRGTMYTRATDGVSDIPFTTRQLQQVVPQNLREQAQENASDIATIIQTSLHQVPEGEHNWARVYFASETKTLKVSKPTNALHNGGAGVALFLAAYGALRDVDKARSLSRDMFNRIIQSGEESRSRRLHGGTEGLASMIYGATTADRFLPNAEWLPRLVLLAESMDTASIAGTTTVDVVAGSAGTVLSLLNLHCATDSTSVLDRAVACGDHLLQNRVQHGSYHVWPGMEENADIGFAHGNAGIGFALDRLARASGHSRFATAARETWDYVWSRYDDEAMAWIEIDDLGGMPRHFGADGEADYQTLAGDSWCRGNTGVLLALFLADTETALKRVDAHIFDRILDMGSEPCDHVCCGAYGRISAVLNIARHLGDADLERRAAEQAQRIAPSQDRQYTPQYGTGYFDPGLYTGLAGIGMTHLEVAHPEASPSILTWS